MNNNFNYNKKLKSFARELRNECTFTENILWKSVLKGRKLKGYQFFRQRPIDNYIADFFCKELKLIVELDGISHKDKIKEDRIKDEDLTKLEYNVIRFNDDFILNDLNNVERILYKWIEEYEQKNPDVIKIKERKKKLIKT
jgi:very-short-patch-repair endonuclease